MRALHSWDVDVAEAKGIQEDLRNRVVLRNTFSRIKKIGGADAAYSKDGKLILGAVVVFSFPAMELLDLTTASAKTTFPYIPGLLTFREGPVLIDAFKMLKVKPDVMIFEGQGICHPRGFGLASHLGLWLNIPSVGCTKTSLLRVPIAVGAGKGHDQIIRKDEKEVGAILRTKENVKPVFVSPGHKIDLAISIELVLATCRGYRMPEPLRATHQVACFMRKQMEKD
jgi:deoxyribonuclease V